MRNAAILAARRRSMRAKPLNATALMRSRCIPIWAQIQSRRILRIRIKGSLFYAAPPMRAALRYSCKERGMLTFTRSLHSARLSSGMRTGNWAWSWAPLFPKTSLSYAGVQGGEIRAAVQAGCTRQGNGLLINASRAILYAGNDADFALAAARAAQRMRDTIRSHI